MTRAGLFEGDHAVPSSASRCARRFAGGHARASVRQRYRSDERKPIEAVYTFPLPTRAVLTGFAMTVGGDRLEGEVHEREEAFRRYDDAIAAGHGSALLEQERSNVFSVSVGNLLPGEETIVEIEYVEPARAELAPLAASIGDADSRPSARASTRSRVDATLRTCRAR